MCRQSWRSGLAWAVGHLALALAVAAQPIFVEVGGARGFAAYHSAPLMGAGVAAADYDDDGDVDLFVPNAEGVPDQLYRNLGNGHFEEIAAAAGVASTLRSRSALWFDYDGDRDLDLAVAGDCFGFLVDCEAGVSTLRLFRQETPDEFVDVTLPAGLFQDAVDFEFWDHRGGLSAGDLDNDGDLDLYAALWDGASSLYRNNGDGTFTDVSLASGIGGVQRGHWQPVMHDFDGDGWLDIFVSIDFEENLLWRNQGDLTFVDVAAAAGVDSAWNEMGVALGDYDNDGDLDIYSTNIYEYEPGEQNVLFRNDSAGGDLTFEEVAASAGVADTSWGWGTTFLDANRDGVLDLAATNGFSYEPYLTDQSRFFLGSGAPQWTFTDVTESAGFDDTYWGSAVVAFDCDRDGDLDLVHTTKLHPGAGPLRLLDNLTAGAGSASHYLVVRPRMPGSNHRAIGAVVRLTAGGVVQTRLITAGISFLGQEPAEAFFGLGGAALAARVEVGWPDGRRSLLAGVAADRELTVSWETILADGFESGDLAGWAN